MKRKCASILCALCIVMVLSSCAHRKDILRTEESQLKLRSMQSRVFETSDRENMLRTIIATMQDLGFVIDRAEGDLGIVSGTKRSGYSLRLTATIRPKGEGTIIVRVNAQYNVTTVEDPEPYQQFFAALSKSLFLEAQRVE